MKPSRFPLTLALHVCTLSLAHAAEWNAMAGDFATAANWARGSVPEGAATAVTIANGGSAQIDLAGSFTVGALMLGNHEGVGGIVQSGGCLNARRIILGGDDAGGGTGSGVYSIADGTLRSVAEEIWIGSKGGVGTLAAAGTSLVSSANWIVVGRYGASGRLALSGNAHLEVLSGNLAVGCNSNGCTSTMEIGDFARVNAAEEIWVGWLGDHSNHGVLNLSGHATVRTGQGFVVGREGAKGTVEVAGNSSLEVGGYLMCGADRGGDGEMVIRDEAHVHAGKQIWLGSGGSTGRITLDGGCLTGHAVPGEDPSGAGIAFRNDGLLTVNGGKVATPGFIKMEGVARLVVDGGMLCATGVPSPRGFFANFADGDLWIGPRGLEFDSRAFSIDVEQSLGGEGKLLKRGTGSLVLKGAAGHAGDTEIVAGRLVLREPLLSDSHRVLIAGPGSRLRLDHGQPDRIAKLVIDGVVQPAGRYEAPGNPGAGVEIGQLEGSGSLEVRFGPDQLTFAEWISPRGTVTGFDADPDGDGIPNGVEQVFGTDPGAFTPLPLLRPQGGGLALLVHPLASPVAADVDYRYEWSSDLSEWHRSGETDGLGVRVEITSALSGSLVEARYQVVSGAALHLFGRVVASRITAP